MRAGINPKPPISPEQERRWRWRKDIAATAERERDEARAQVALMAGALAELSTKVFGTQAGDEPNVYSDYDELTALGQRTRQALSLTAPEALAKWDAMRAAITAAREVQTDIEAGCLLKHGGQIAPVAQRLRRALDSLSTPDGGVRT